MEVEYDLGFPQYWEVGNKSVQPPPSCDGNQINQEGDFQALHGVLHLPC